MKKRILYLLALALAVVLFAAIFVGCEGTEDPASGGGENGEATEEGSESQAPAETLDDSKFNIFFNKEYLVTFVQPDKSTDDEKAVIKEIRLSLAEQTKKQLTFVNESKVTDDNAFCIVVGKTKHQESKDLYATLGEREAAVKVVGNKIFVAFDTKESGIGVVRTLMGELAKSSKGQVRLSHNYKAEYKALPPIADLPDYAYGTVQAIDCGEGTTMFYVTGALLAQFEQYCDSVEAAEFKKIAAREEKNNVFRTFVGETDYIYAYYTDHNRTVRVITGPIDQLAQNEYKIDAEKEYTPYIASIPQPNNGMGYIIRLSDGRFLIFDGGYSGSDRVYSTLKQLEPKENIVIAAWFISHPHGDHYPAFIDFIKAHGKDPTVKLERVIHNYTNPDDYVVPNSSAGPEDCSAAVKELYAVAKQYVPDVPIMKGHTGQFIDFGTAQIEVLYTMEDHLPTALDNTNASSMVVRVYMENQSIIMLADTYVASANIMHAMWGNYLKSDIVQMAHHGQWPANAQLYHDVQGKLVLVPAVLRNYKSDIQDSRWKDVTNAMLQYAKDLSVSGDKIIILELPYTFENNKDQMVDYIKNYRG